MTETSSADDDHIIMDDSEIKKETTSVDNEHVMRDTSEIKKELDNAVFLDDSKKEIKMRLQEMISEMKKNLTQEMKLRKEIEMIL